MPKKRRNKWLALGVGVAFFVVVLGFSAGAMAYSYKDKYYPGVQVAGIQLGGLTKQEGRKLIASRVQSYLEHPLRIVVPDLSKPLPDQVNAYQDMQIPTTAGHLGLAYASGAAADEAWSVGHVYSPLEWGKSVVSVVFGGRSEPIDYTINTKAVEAFIDGEVVPKIGTPTPAKVVVKGDDVTVSPAIPGYEVDEVKLRQMVATSLAVAADKDTTYLKAPVGTVDSPITTKTVQPLADRLNSLGNTKISVTATDVTASPNRAQILSWFSVVQDDKGALSLAVQRETVAAYLVQQKALDQDKSLAAAMKALAPLAEATTVPTTLAVAAVAKPVKAPVVYGDYTPGKFEGKYVEVNLAEQRMYLVIGNDLVKSYVVSSGKWSTPTPKGTFAIHGKITRAFSASFGLWMPYWQNFLGGEYGLHELPEWPNGYKEGANHLGTPVSHGCVRLGVGDAKEVYNWTEEGTPVYIH